MFDANTCVCSQSNEPFNVNYSIIQMVEINECSLFISLWREHKQRKSSQNRKHNFVYMFSTLQGYGAEYTRLLLILTGGGNLAAFTASRKKKPLTVGLLHSSSFCKDSFLTFYVSFNSLTVEKQTGNVGREGVKCYKYIVYSY